MLRSALTLGFLCVTLPAFTASACFLSKPNYSYKLSGAIQLEENGKKYTDCVVTDGYVSLKNGEVFRLQSLIIECNERMLGHNSAYLTLKNGEINAEDSAFDGSYDSHNLYVEYKIADQDGTYEETDDLEFNKKCDQLNIDIDVKKTGTVNYKGKISGVVSAKFGARKRFVSRTQK